jgi:preprotein translocase subunit SecD
VARPTYRPGRTLGVFLLGIAILFGLVALAGQWKPALGLDLQGGTRITLTAIGDPSQSQLDQARGIIDKRVNGSGVTESEVVTQSGKFVVVEIPGDSRRDLIETVQRQARLSFRVIACSTQDQGPCAAAGAGDATLPGLNRPAPAGLVTEDDPAATTTPSPSSSPGATEAPTDETKTAAGDVKGALKWRDAPPQDWIAKFNATTCPISGDQPEDFDDPNKPLVTCDEDGVKYLLSAATNVGEDLDEANAQQAQQNLEWQVGIKFRSDRDYALAREFGPADERFGEVSQALAPTGGALHGEQFAIVLDGNVISAPTMDAVLSKEASISGGDMGQDEATSLATSLKYGALPIAFEKDSTVETVGPSLAGDQLTAGLTAGAFGLGLVMLYCLLYYRGLGLVVLASLGVAASATYALVLLLSKTAGFTLTLPGIAGLIIAVGITADSFIIFFERIRDEMREGKSMRVAVESGWVRARKTRLAANVVSLLSASILYIFASGVVKGFGFALGLSTLVDLAVLFWFTKPLVSFLARYHFFNGGGRLSGLSPETLGTDAVTAGGKA